jgi:hypothetical protein
MGVLTVFKKICPYNKKDAYILPKGTSAINTSTLQLPDNCICVIQ